MQREFPPRLCESMRTRAELLFYIVLNYPKLPISISDQTSLLKGRGLVIGDDTYTKEQLGIYLKPQMPFCVLVCFVFTAVFVYRVVFAVCKPQRFLFCLSPYLFSEWHIVPQLYIQIKQSRVHSRKALYECKASRRLGKQIRCFYRFLSKGHPIFKVHTTA